MSHDEMQKNELIDLARQIHAWQERCGLKTPQLIREFKNIGADRTFRDLREGQIERYDYEQQLANYRAVWAEIQARDERAAEEPVYSDLSAVEEIRRATLEAMRTNGSNRVVIVLAGSGMGKSFALKALRDKYGSRIITVEAGTVWQDRPGELLGAILRSAGYEGNVQGTTERMVKVQEILRKSRRCVAVDEAHHMGPHCLGTIKALVNTTPGEFLLCAMATLWHRMESGAYQEARQISTNRLCERVRLALTNEDIVKYLAHVFPACDKAAIKKGACIIRPAADNCGNMAFVRDVARQTRDMLGDGDQPTAEVFAEAVKAVSARR
jgi:DNA transposition AAA+ family ATPase